MTRKFFSTLLLVLTVASFTISGGGAAFADPYIDYDLEDGKVGRSYYDYVLLQDSSKSGTTISSTNWSVSGTIPPGLVMGHVSTTAVKYTANFSGTPTTLGTYTFTLRATINYADGTTASASKNFTIKILSTNTLEIKYYLKDGTVGEAYSDYVMANGGTSPYTFSATGTPSGLTFTQSGATYTLSGTPRAAGDFNIQVTLRDSAGASVNKTIPITIESNGSDEDEDTSDLGFRYDYFVEGTVGRAYSDFIRAEGGTAPYTWSYSGTLPGGLTLSQSTSNSSLYTLSGTPNQAGSFPVVFTIRDNAGNTISRTITIKINPSAATPLSINRQYTNGTVGVPYFDYIEAKGGIVSYDWTYSGNDFPSGKTSSNMKNMRNMIFGDNRQYLAIYSVDSSDVEGGPTTAGDYTFTLYLKDRVGSQISKDFTIKIYEPMEIQGAFKNAQIGTYYTDSIQVVKGNGVYTWENDEEFVGANYGLELRYDNATGKATLSGNPIKAGTFDFTVKVSTSQPYRRYSDTDNMKTTAWKKFTVTVYDTGTTYVETPVSNDGGTSNGGLTADDLKDILKLLPSIGGTTIDDHSTHDERSSKKSETDVESKSLSLSGSGGCEMGIGVLGFMLLGGVLLSKRSR